MEELQELHDNQLHAFFTGKHSVYHTIVTSTQVLIVQSLDFFLLLLAYVYQRAKSSKWWMDVFGPGHFGLVRVQNVLH